MIPAGPPQAKIRWRATAGTPQKHGFHQEPYPGPNPTTHNHPPRHRRMRAAALPTMFCGHFRQKMTTNGRNVQSADNFNGVLGPLEPYLCLRGSDA